MIMNTENTVVVYPVKKCPMCFGQMRKFNPYGLTDLKNVAKKKFCTNKCKFNFIKSLEAMRSFDIMINNMSKFDSEKHEIMSEQIPNKIPNKIPDQMVHISTKSMVNKISEEPKSVGTKIVHRKYKIAVKRFGLKKVKNTMRSDYSGFRIIFKRYESELIKTQKIEQKMKYKTIKKQLRKMNKIKSMIGDTFYQDEMKNMMMNHPYYSNNKISNDQIATAVISYL